MSRAIQSSANCSSTETSRSSRASLPGSSSRAPRTPRSARGASTTATTCSPGSTPIDAACVALAFELVRDYALRTLDALHLAVLRHQVVPLFGEAVLVSCDTGQLAAARALGLDIV